MTPLPRPHRMQSAAPSLAQQLSRTLTLAVMAVWLLGTALVAWYVDRQIQHNFDVELMESAHRQLYPALLDWHQQVQVSASSSATTPSPSIPKVMGEVPNMGETEPLLLQLRDAQGQVLLRSQAAPAASFAIPLRAGYFDTPEFRVFSLYDAHNQLWLQLADPLSERNEASRRTVLGLSMLLVVMLPLLAWLTHRVATRALRQLQHLQQQMTDRSGSNLQPLATDHMPRELQAVGEGVNGLLSRLEEALNVERTLAANAAHELRTPLAEVRLRLHTVVDQALAQQVASPSAAPTKAPAMVPVYEVQSALQSLETLSHRTERLLQLSRAEGGDAAHFAPVDLVQLAQQVAQSFWQHPLAQKRLDWLPPEDADSVWVHGDIDSLAIVLRNLLDNALHHTAAPVELAVQALPQPALVVRDHGPGLTAAQQALMLERHARIASQHMGYGLGMSIVRTIADKHGATLVLTSPLPSGAQGLEVRLVFAQPLQPAPRAAHPIST